MSTPSALVSTDVVYTAGIASLKSVSKETPLPIPPSHIAIKVHYVGLNPIDYKLMGLGLFKLWPKQRGLGQEFSGEVVLVGADVTDYAPGDRVCGLLSDPFLGALKTYLISPHNQNRVLKIPPQMPYDQAASFMMSFGTAYNSLAFVDWHALPEPSSLLILGGSTNAGVFAAQLAKKCFGITTVVATCSTKSIPRVSAFGVDYTLDYTDKSASIPAQAADLIQSKLGGAKFDMIFDCVGGTELFASISSLLKPASTGAYYVSIVGDDPNFGLSWGLVTVASKMLLSRRCWGYNYKLYVLESHESFLDAARKEILTPTSSYEIPIDTVYPWTEYKQALEKIMTHQAKGKVILKVDGDSVEQTKD